MVIYKMGNENEKMQRINNFRAQSVRIISSLLLDKALCNSSFPVTMLENEQRFRILIENGAGLFGIPYPCLYFIVAVARNFAPPRWLLALPIHNAPWMRRGKFQMSVQQPLHHSSLQWIDFLMKITCLKVVALRRSPWKLGSKFWLICCCDDRGWCYEYHGPMIRVKKRRMVLKTYQIHYQWPSLWRSRWIWSYLRK